MPTAGAPCGRTVTTWPAWEFVLTDDGLVGVDLDAVLDQQGAIVDPAISELVAKLGSYTEISPSGRGLRCLIHRPPAGAAGRQARVSVSDRADEERLEIYASQQFLT